MMKLAATSISSAAHEAFISQSIAILQSRLRYHRWHHSGMSGQGVDSRSENEKERKPSQEPAPQEIGFWKGEGMKMNTYHHKRAALQLE